MGIISVENKIPVFRRDAVSQEQELKKAKGTILRTYYLWTRKRKKNNEKKFSDRCGGKIYGRLTILRGQKVSKQRHWLTVSDAIGRSHGGQKRDQNIPLLEGDSWHW